MKWTRCGFDRLKPGLLLWEAIGLSTRPCRSAGMSSPKSRRIVGVTSINCIPAIGPAGAMPGPAAIRRPSWAWLASSGPVSFSKVWICPVPTVPTDRQRRSPK